MLVLLRGLFLLRVIVWLNFFEKFFIFLKNFLFFEKIFIFKNFFFFFFVIFVNFIFLKN